MWWRKEKTNPEWEITYDQAMKLHGTALSCIEKMQKDNISIDPMHKILAQAILELNEKLKGR